MTDEPTTLELAILAMQYVAPAERHQFIRDTVTRLWDRQFIEWYTYLIHFGNAIHKASGGRLRYNLMIGGFANGGTTGMVGLKLFSDGRPLAKFVPALYGDFAGGLSNADKVSITIAEIGAGGTLSKPAGANLQPVDRVTVTDLEAYGRRMVALLDEHTIEPGPGPDRRSWWRRLLGGKAGRGKPN